MVLIVSGGEKPPKRLLKARAAAAELVIAADRGALYCSQAGIRPDLVVGDMDSLPPDVLDDLAKQRVEIMRLKSDKDETDTQVALAEAMARGGHTIEILSAIGTRFDHSLANVQLLTLAHKAGVQARILTRHQSLFVVEGAYELSHAQGCTVSFLPLDATVQGVTLTGFVYDLEDASMELGRPYGVSNVVKDAKAWVRVEQGRLLVVLTLSGRNL